MATSSVESRINRASAPLATLARSSTASAFGAPESASRGGASPSWRGERRGDAETQSGIDLARPPLVENWQVAVLVLVAVLVGGIIPVLFQLRATLRAMETALNGTLPRVEETLDDLSKLVVKVSQLVEGVQSTTRVVGAIGAAIGPAIVAGLSSYRSARAESESESEKEADYEQRARLESRV
jgi:hypothetical protein